MLPPAFRLLDLVDHPCDLSLVLHVFKPSDPQSEHTVLVL